MKTNEDSTPGGLLITSGDRPYTCIHCKKVYPNFNALRSHLKGCSKRRLSRSFDVGGTRYTLLLNPKKRIMDPLNELINSNPTNDQLFLGAVLYLQYAKLIDSYVAEKIDKNSDL